MPSDNHRAPSVLFTDRTALQIARAAQGKGLELPKSSIRTAPDRAPLHRDVLEAIDQVQARLPGLVLERPVHVLVGAAPQAQKNGLFVAHSCAAALTKGSFCRVSPRACACVPALAFVRAAARGESDVALLVLGFELCGTYRTLLTCRNNSYDIKPLMSSRDLRDYAAHNAGVKGARRAARAAQLVADGSASPRETQLALLLGLPRARGGAGLGMPTMNYEVEATREAAVIAQRPSFRCDLCWPEARLDVEYQSREVHANETSRISDSRRENALHSMGWQVENVTNDELNSMSACDTISKTLRKALGKDPRIRVKDYYDRQLTLRVGLGLPIDFVSLRG